MIQTMIATIDAVRPSPPMTLYRGIRGDYEVGDSFIDLAFASKTTNLETARRFSGNNCCVLIMDYPEPSQQYSLYGASQWDEEEEWLSYPGEMFYLTERVDERTLRGVYVGNYYDGNFNFPLNPELDRVYDQVIYPSLAKLRENHGVLMSLSDTDHYLFGDFPGLRNWTEGSEDTSLDNDYYLRAKFFNQQSKSLIYIDLDSDLVHKVEWAKIIDITTENNGFIRERTLDLQGSDIPSLVAKSRVLNDIVTDKVLSLTIDSERILLPYREIIWRK